MKIAKGVSVNEKKLPTKEQLIESALKGKMYFQLPKSKAIKLINTEIKASGLFKTTGLKELKNQIRKGLKIISIFRCMKMSHG